MHKNLENFAASWKRASAYGDMVLRRQDPDRTVAAKQKKEGLFFRNRLDTFVHFPLFHIKLKSVTVFSDIVVFVIVSSYIKAIKILIHKFVLYIYIYIQSLSATVRFLMYIDVYKRQCFERSCSLIFSKMLWRRWENRNSRNMFWIEK